LLEVSGFLSACCFVVAYAAVAGCGFAAVGAHAGAFVDEVAAFFACWLVFFCFHFFFASF
jgi:hypothetical protein